MLQYVSFNMKTQIHNKKNKLSYIQIFALGFLAVILIGTILLCLPVSSKANQWTSFLDALFTSTSATCVTGLIVFDTFTHFSLFGQIVILLLIQVGGLGLMTFIAIISIILGKKVSFYKRKSLMQTTGSINLSETVNLLFVIFKITFAIELIGAILLSIRFIPMFGTWEGIYYSIFHSISAFCNAGFDLMGRFSEYSSLTTFASDKLVLITIMLLVICGGLGFVVWKDIAKHKFRFKNYSLHSKIVLVTSLSLILVGAVVTFTCEYNNVMANLSFGDKIVNALFQSVTCRTAGFNSIAQNTLSGATVVISVFLMFVGGSPSSTAGGVKTTTFSILLLNTFAMAKKNKSVETKRRKFDDSLIKQASAIFNTYLLLILISMMIILPSVEKSGIGFVECLYEVVSAIATVGIAMGTTANFSVIAKIVLIMLMFIGRIGGFSMVMMLNKKQTIAPTKKPNADILIG